MRIIDDIEFKAAEQATPISTTAELLSARYKQAFQGSFSPARSDALEYRDAEASQYKEGGQTLFGAMFGDKPDYEIFTKNVTLTQAEAEAKAKSAGVKVAVPTTGMTEAGLDFLIKRRTEEMKREFVFSTAEKSFTNSALGFGADFAGMLSDPANVAFSFVPIVGPAKYTQLLAGAGGLAARTGIRAGIGAAEGLAGAAILEPFILSNRQELQDDYDIYDSMFNIASGAAFGSALHAGGGLFGDTASKALGYEPEWKKLQPKVDPVSGKPTGAVLSDLDIKTAKQQLEIMDALSEVSLPRTGMEAANVIDARIAGLREASARVLDKDVVIQLKAEQDELAMLLTDVNRIERERIAGNVVKQRDGVLDTLSPEELKLATDRLAEIKVTLEQHKLGMDSAKSLKELNEKLGKIDLDSDLIELSERINPSNRKYYELRESKELTPENRKALDTDIYAPIRPIMAQLAPETQARMFRAVIAQVAEGRPPDAMAAMLSDPKLIDMPGVREQVVKLAKENLAEPANITNRMAREADEAYARSLSTGDASKDAELLLYEQSTFADYMARSGLDKSEAEMKAINRAIEADELEFSKAKSQADAAKQAAACLMGAL